MRGFPSLKWFRRSEPSDYTGGRTEKKIVDAHVRKMGHVQVLDAKNMFLDEKWARRTHKQVMADTRALLVILALAVAALTFTTTHGAAVREAASEFRVKVSSTRPISSMCGLARSAAASGRRVVPVRPLG